VPSREAASLPANQASEDSVALSRLMSPSVSAMLVPRRLVTLSLSRQAGGNVHVEAATRGVLAEVDVYAGIDRTRFAGSYQVGHGERKTFRMSVPN